MNKIDRWLYEGCEEYMPQETGGKREKIISPNEALAAEVAAQMAEAQAAAAADAADEREMTLGEKAAGYAEALKNDAATPKGAHDNADYAKAIFIIAFSVIAFYFAFAVGIKVLVHFIQTIAQ